MKNKLLTINVRDKLRYLFLPQWLQMATDVRSIIPKELQDVRSSVRLKRTAQ